MKRIIKRPLPTLDGRRKHRAVFISRGTDTDDDIGRRTLRWKKITNRLAPLAGNINATFRHGCYSTRMHVTGWLGTCRAEIKVTSGKAMSIR